MTPQLTAKIRSLARTGKLTRGNLEQLLRGVHDPWEAARGILHTWPVNPLRYQKRVRRNRVLKG